MQHDDYRDCVGSRILAKASASANPDDVLATPEAS